MDQGFLFWRSQSKLVKHPYRMIFNILETQAVLLGETCMYSTKWSSTLGSHSSLGNCLLPFPISSLPLKNLVSADPTELITDVNSCQQRAIIKDFGSNAFQRLGDVHFCQRAAATEGIPSDTAHRARNFH